MNDFKVGDIVVVSPNATRWCSLKPHLGIVVKCRGSLIGTCVVVLQDGRKRLFKTSSLKSLTFNCKNYLTNQKNPDTI